MIAVSPEQRLNLTEEIKGTLKAKPLRRVWIPKLGRDEKRPLLLPFWLSIFPDGFGSFLGFFCLS